MEKNNIQEEQNIFAGVGTVTPPPEKESDDSSDKGDVKDGE